MAGTLADGRVELTEVHRFENRPIRRGDGLHWDLEAILREVLHGLRATAELFELRGIGVDSWGVDYGLVDAGGRLLADPFHYRDSRTEGMIERAFERVPREELYSVTGIQTIPINTVFQLLAEEGSPTLAAAERILLVPDLVALRLTGRQSNESTIASTTGLLDARTGDWARPTIERLGLPAPIFDELIEPGTEIGPLLPVHGAGAPPVFAVAGHDTASAFAAAPAGAEGSAVLSSGTWSLLGVEVGEPVLGPRAMEANLTNERGLDGTIRLLRNVMGLWLVQECRRAWGRESYDELHRLAAAARADVPLFDPDADEVLRRGDMPARIAAVCERLGQPAPDGRGELGRSILSSLACKYRFVVERIEELTGRAIEVVHVVGGGARNGLLCRLSADLLGRAVVAGQVEATSLGNVPVQARARGELATLADIRQVAAASSRPQTYEPAAKRSLWEEAYGRFLELTGLGTAAALAKEALR